MNEASIDIFPPYEAFYIESMMWHTKSALRSINTIEEWVALIKQDSEAALQINKEDVFNELQNIIQQSGAISRFLFPPQKGENKEHHKRGVKLRKSLEIYSDSCLSNRDIRNQMEHFEEHLDLYFKKFLVGHIIPNYIGLDEEASEVPQHIFKAFYINPMVFALLEEKYQLLPIFEELKKIHHILSECAANGYRLPQQ